MFSKITPDDEKILSSFMGPGATDKMLRAAMNLYWISLPKSKRSIDAIEQHVKQVLDRASDDMRKDEKYGTGK